MRYKYSFSSMRTQFYEDRTKFEAEATRLGLTIEEVPSKTGNTSGVIDSTNPNKTRAKWFSKVKP